MKIHKRDIATFGWHKPQGYWTRCTIVVDVKYTQRVWNKVTCKNCLKIRKAKEYRR